MLVCCNLLYLLTKNIDTVAKNKFYETIFEYRMTTFFERREYHVTVFPSSLRSPFVQVKHD